MIFWFGTRPTPPLVLAPVPVSSPGQRSVRSESIERSSAAFHERQSSPSVPANARVTSQAVRKNQLTGLALWSR